MKRLFYHKMRWNFRGHSGEIHPGPFTYQTETGPYYWHLKKTYIYIYINTYNNEKIKRNNKEGTLKFIINFNSVKIEKINIKP